MKLRYRLIELLPSAAGAKLFLDEHYIWAIITLVAGVIIIEGIAKSNIGWRS